MNWITTVLRYINTARFLSPGQIAFQLLRRVQERALSSAPNPDSSSDPEALNRIKECAVHWGPADATSRISRARKICEGRFVFLNHEERLDTIDWNGRYASHLWNYNLHYFDYALDLAWAWRLTSERQFADRFQSLAQSWISSTQPGRGDAWAPYAISVRTVNWTIAAALFGGALADEFATRFWGSIGSQLAFLERRLEFHIRANHLQRNYRALLLGGLALRGRDPSRWRRIGSEGLWAELLEQVLDDGGHFERSPMYHMIALADYLECCDLLRASGDAAPSSAVERLHRMVDAAGALARPDGSLHLFNDSANGVAPATTQVARLAQQMIGKSIPRNDGPFSLPRTGFFGLADLDSGERIVADCGEPGPSFQPGHAHCDLLSFELDLAGVPFIVNSGTSGYEGDPFRDYQRSTRAHNTVAIDGKNQMDVWSTFRVAKRARVGAATAAMNSGTWRFRGAYSPYHARGATHQREITRLLTGHWRVVDTVTGAEGKQLTSYLHFHPEWSVSPDGDTFACRHGNGTLVRIAPFGFDESVLVVGRTDPPQGWYSPEFGVQQPAACLEMTVMRNTGASLGFEVLSESNGNSPAASLP